MPTYQYACTTCGEQLEVVQKFTDDPLTECPACQGQLRKLFNSVGIVFKGSGFYRTDSRNGSTAAAPGKAGSDAAASASAGTSEGSSSESKPAATANGGGSTGSSSKADSSGSSSTTSSGSSAKAATG